MHLSSILNEYGIDIKTTKIVRHPLNNKKINVIFNKGMIEAYQANQSKPIFDGCDHIVTFIGTVGNESKFIGVYEVVGRIEGKQCLKKMPKDYPYPEEYSDKYYYELKKTDIMSDLFMRLSVDWVNAVSWAQWAKNDKEVLSIMPNHIVEFPGYENVVLSYAELFNVIYGGLEYEKWRDALTNVNGIYLICDLKNNKQYVGATYNKDGILGRWKNYIDTYDGGDVELARHIKNNPKAYEYFQFSILQILPKAVTDKEAIPIERLYKKKLNSLNRDYGLNLN